MFYLVGLCCLLASGSATALVREESFTLSDGRTMQYVVVLPNNYDPERAYPAILAIPEGYQTIRAASAGVQNYWGAEAEKRGYLVFSPAVPGSKSFFEGAEAVIPEFLQRIKVRYRVRGKFHLTGVAYGGISALRIASNSPENFRSVMVLPGYFWTPTDEKYKALKGLCVVYIASTGDGIWTINARRDVERLRAAGLNPHLDLIPGIGLVARTYAYMGSGKLYDMLESRTGC